MVQRTLVPVLQQRNSVATRSAEIGKLAGKSGCRQDVRGYSAQLGDTDTGLHIMRPLGLTLITVALAAAGTAGVCAAQARLSPEGSGLGLKPQNASVESAADLPSGGDGIQGWQPKRSSEFTLYNVVREFSRPGLGAAETVGSLFYALPRGWGSTFEAGYAQESLFVPRRYSLGGQVHAALSDGKALSMGLKYRVYDTDQASRSGALSDSPYTQAYTLAPTRATGAGLTQSYQVQFSYQHSAASTFGLAMGRDLETPSSPYDLSTNSPRQVSFTGQHWFTPTWALSYDVLTSDPSNLSRIQGYGLRFGVRYHF